MEYGRLMWYTTLHNATVDWTLSTSIFCLSCVIKIFPMVITLHFLKKKMESYDDRKTVIKV